MSWAQSENILEKKDLAHLKDKSLPCLERRLRLQFGANEDSQFLVELQKSANIPKILRQWWRFDLDFGICSSIIEEFFITNQREVCFLINNKYISQKAYVYLVMYILRKFPLLIFETDIPFLFSIYFYFLKIKTY